MLIFSLFGFGLSSGLMGTGMEVMMVTVLELVVVLPHNLLCLLV
jgi:hypothetical protein